MTTCVTDAPTASEPAKWLVLLEKSDDDEHSDDDESTATATATRTRGLIERVSVM